MPGRPAQRVGHRGARADQVRRGLRGVRRAPDRGPAARADQRHRVVAVQPGPAVHGGRGPQRQPGQQARGGEHVGHHPVPAVLPGQPGGLPVRPDRGQVIEQRWVVHPAQDRVVVLPRGGNAARPPRPARRAAPAPAPGPRSRARAGPATLPRRDRAAGSPRSTPPAPAGSPAPSPGRRGGVSIAGCRAFLILASPSGCCHRARPGRCSTCPGPGWGTRPSGGTSRPAGRPRHGADRGDRDRPGRRPVPLSRPGRRCGAQRGGRMHRPAGRAGMGLAETPVFLTSTMQLGRVYDAACELLDGRAGRDRRRGRDHPHRGRMRRQFPQRKPPDASAARTTCGTRWRRPGRPPGRRAAHRGRGRGGHRDELPGVQGRHRDRVPGGAGRGDRRRGHDDQLRRPGTAHGGRGAGRAAAARPR